MHDKSKRALRRIALARMKRKARRIYPWDETAKYANHLHPCSCSMGCGNPRRHFGGPTIQERRAAQWDDLQTST